MADAFSRLLYQLSFSKAEIEISHLDGKLKTDTFIPSKWFEASHQVNTYESDSSKRLLPSKFSIEERMRKREGKVCVPQIPSIKDMVLKDGHDSPCARHLGIKKTLELIRYHYWWSPMGKGCIRLCV
jgi:hypothetical protein